MNVLSAKVAMRDRTLVDVLDFALRFVVEHAKAFAALSAIVLLPCFLVTWAISVSAGWILGWMVAASLLTFAEAPFVALASRLVFDDAVPIRTALAVAVRALPRLLALRTLQLIGVFSGVLFFLLPGVWLAALFFFGTEVVVLEQSSVGNAVGRLQRLGTGYFGDVMLAMLAIGFLYALGIALGDVTGHAILQELLQIRLRPGDDEIGGPIALLAAWMCVPVLTVARFFVYLNLRTRREGWDIQTRFAALAARGATAEERQAA